MSRECAGIPVVGLAGGIGAGKSRVAGILGEAGCVVSDSDADARAALTDPNVVSALTAIAGAGILGGDGSVDRGRLAAAIFSDDGVRARVEAVMHPWIEQRRRALFAEACRRSDSLPAALVIDAPLLFEAGLDGQCDAVIFVDAPYAQRLARVQVTRGWSEEELMRREQAQWDVDRKRERATYVITNDSDDVRLREQTMAVLRAIVSPG